MNTWATLRTERSCSNKRDRSRGFKKMAFNVSAREEWGGGGRSGGFLSENIDVKWQSNEFRPCGCYLFPPPLKRTLLVYVLAENSWKPCSFKAAGWPGRNLHGGKYRREQQSSQDLCFERCPQRWILMTPYDQYPNMWIMEWSAGKPGLVALFKFKKHENYEPCFQLPILQREPHCVSCEYP